MSKTYFDVQFCMYFLEKGHYAGNILVPRDLTKKQYL